MFDFGKKLQSFPGIDLEQLNTSASFLDRIDRKYLITQKQLDEILTDFSDDFYVLNIMGKSIFSYDNVYMDSDDYDFYYQHQNKAKSRVKIRTRNYVDSHLAFFEFKQKLDGITRKFRYQIPWDEHGIMTKEAKWFFKWVYMSFYGTKGPKISPSICTKYSRMTLVHKDSSERVTIDFDIHVQDLRDKKSKPIALDNLVIVESKSMSQKGFSHTVMKKHSIKKARSCSKYGLWLIYSWLAKKFSIFEDTMKAIAVIRKEVKKNKK